MHDRNYERPGLTLYGVPHPNDGPAHKVPSKYTVGLHKQIVKLVLEGNHPDTAARSCGISAPLFREWMKRGEEEGEGSCLYALWCDVDRAFAQAEIGATKVVVEAANEDPKFAAWWLERAASERWNKQTQVIVRGELESFLSKLEAALPPHLFEQVLRVATGRAGPVEVGQEDEAVH
jgi:hypothetical protein